MKKLFNKVFLFTILMVCLICANMVGRRVNINYDENIFGLSINYIEFELDGQLNNELYQQIITIPSFRTIITYDDGSDVMDAKIGYDVLNKNIVITEGFMFGDLEFNRGKDISYCKLGYHKQEKYNCVAFYQFSDESEFKQFKIINNIGYNKSLKENVFVDFNNRDEKEEMLEILALNNINVKSESKISYESAMDQIKNESFLLIRLGASNPLSLMLMLSFLSYVVFGFFMILMEIYKQKNEIKLLNNMGITNKTIILKEMKSELASSIIVQALCIIIGYFIFKDDSFVLLYAYISIVVTTILTLLYLVNYLICLCLVVRRLKYEKIKN